MGGMDGTQVLAPVRSELEDRVRTFVREGDGRAPPGARRNAANRRGPRNEPGA